MNVNVNVKVPISIGRDGSVYEHQGRTAHDPIPDNLGSSSRPTTTPPSNNSQFSMSKEVHQISREQNHNHYHQHHSRETSMSMDGQRVVVTRQIMEKVRRDVCPSCT